MKLGTALLGETGAPRRVLAAPLPSDPTRLVDLGAVETERLRKLGEGDPATLAQARVPASLRRLLEAGPRGLHRAEQALAYAEKWARKGDLPESLAPLADRVRFLPCLPRPVSLRLPDGTFRDRLAVAGPGDRLPWGAELELRPTLGVLGQAGGAPGGFALAVAAGAFTVLGPWMHGTLDLRGSLRIVSGRAVRSAPLEPWQGLVLPRLRPGELLLLPPPIWAPLLARPGDRVKVETPFDTLSFEIGTEGTHPTLQ